MFDFLKSGLPIKKFISIWWNDLDKRIFFISISLALIGLVFVGSVGFANARKVNLAGSVFVKKQILYIIVSWFVMIAISMMDKDDIVKFSFLMYLILLTALMLVLVNSSLVKGAKRWINIAGFSFQPSEIMKPFFIIVNAYILRNTSYEKSMVRFNTKALFLSIFLLISFIAPLMMQPDFGMSFTVIGIWSIQVFISRIDYKIMLSATLLLLIFLIVAALKVEYISSRVQSFMVADLESYQVAQSLKAVSGSSWFGSGLFQGANKFNIPDVHADYIFAAIIEETGFIGSSILVLLYLYYCICLVRPAMKSIDSLAILSCFGISAMFFFGFMLSSSVSLNIIPSTGNSFMFISYGGSAILSANIATGLMLVFSKRRKYLQSDY